MAATATQSSDRSRTVRVCVCDDMQAFRRLMTFALADDPGIEVVCEAGDGVECVDNVARSRPDVLLLDLAMPGRDGLEVLDDLREHAPEIGVVVVSGFGAERMRDTVLAHGARAYVEKGAPLDEIRAAVHEAALHLK